MGLSSTQVVNGIDQCFGNLVYHKCDALFSYNRKTGQGLVVFDNWLKKYPLAQLALRNRMYYWLQTNRYAGNLGMLPVEAEYKTSLTEKERELYLSDIEMPWDNWPLLLPAPEENRRIEYDVTTGSGWLQKVPIHY